MLYASIIILAALLQLGTIYFLREKSFGVYCGVFQ